MTGHRGPAGPNAQSSARELVITRTFSCPPSRLFSAWTDQSLLIRWWAPRGLTTPFCTADPRQGGHFRYCMRSPDGRNYWGRGTYTEVVAPERIVYTDVFTDPDGNPVPPAHYGMNETFPHEARVTVTFAEHDDGTVMTLRHDIPPSVPEFAQCRQGWTEMFDRLTEVLADPAEFTVAHTFDAPRERVFRAWTDVERLRPWWGPKGFPMATCTLDARPGGAFHYLLRSPGGQEMWGKWSFREVVPPARLVFTSSFSNAASAVTRAPFSDTWPLETLTTIAFTEHDGRTTMTMTAFPINATEAEQSAFAAMHDSMRAGWGGTLDQLAAALAGP